MEDYLKLKEILENLDPKMREMLEKECAEKPLGFFEYLEKDQKKD